jgi:hypothetical protein
MKQIDKTIFYIKSVNTSPSSSNSIKLSSVSKALVTTGVGGSRWCGGVGGGSNILVLNHHHFFGTLAVTPTDVKNSLLAFLSPLDKSVSKCIL